MDDDDYYKGVPALVVEVISESTRRKDLVKKLDLYMSCGVREYWTVNPLNAEIAVYVFEERNIVGNVTYKRAETAQSVVFAGLAVEVNRVFGV